MAKKLTKKGATVPAVCAGTEVPNTSSVRQDTCKVTAATRMMRNYGVSEIFENTRGEFFTNINFALCSEMGDKSRVTTHKKK